MKSPVLILISTFLMAACANNQGTAGHQGSAANPVVTSFSTGEQDTLEVQVTDREPVTRAELAAPDGRIFLAQRIDRERLTRQGGGYGQPSLGVGVGVAGGSGGHVGTGVGVGFGFPFIIGGSDDYGYREPRVTSTALIHVPDMAAYRAQWQQWKVRVYLGEGASQRMIEVAAPQPAAG